MCKRLIRHAACLLFLLFPALAAAFGDQEAAITYFAVRHWQGWGAGRILNFDIGGGSFEFSTGTDALPDAAMSVPLGVGRLTREFFDE